MPHDPARGGLLGLGFVENQLVFDWLAVGICAGLRAGAGFSVSGDLHGCGLDRLAAFFRDDFVGAFTLPSIASD